MSTVARTWLFWSALYAACAAAALAVTPGLPEALGFALPVLLAAAATAWLLRARSLTARRTAVVAIALVLTIGALSGMMGRGGDLTRQTAAAASLG